MLVTLYIKVSFRYVEFKRSMKNSGLLSIETNPIMSEKSNEALVVKEDEERKNTSFYHLRECDCCQSLSLSFPCP